jgi:hypothetical protein
MGRWARYCDRRGNKRKNPIRRYAVSNRHFAQLRSRMLSGDQLGDLVLE